MAEQDARRVRQMAEELRDTALQVEAENQLLLAGLKAQNELIERLSVLAEQAISHAEDKEAALADWHQLMQLRYRLSYN